MTQIARRNSLIKWISLTTTTSSRSLTHWFVVFVTNTNWDCTTFWCLRIMETDWSLGILKVLAFARQNSTTTNGEQEVVAFIKLQIGFWVLGYKFAFKCNGLKFLKFVWNSFFQIYLNVVFNASTNGVDVLFVTRIWHWELTSIGKSVKNVRFALIDPTQNNVRILHSSVLREANCCPPSNSFWRHFELKQIWLKFTFIKTHHNRFVFGVVGPSCSILATRVRTVDRVMELVLALKTNTIRYARQKAYCVCRNRNLWLCTISRWHLSCTSFDANLCGRDHWSNSMWNNCTVLKIRSLKSKLLETHFGKFSALNREQKVIAFVVFVTKNSVIFRVAGVSLSQKCCFQNTVNMCTDSIFSLHVLDFVDFWAV